MDSFWQFLESQKIGDYLDSLGNAKKVEEWLLNHADVREFLSQVDRANLIKPTEGKKGYLVMSKASQYQPFDGLKSYDSFTGNAYQHRIPVAIVKIDGYEAELARTDGKNFEEITYKVPHFPDPKTKSTIIVPLNRITIVKQDQYHAYLKWLVYAVSEGAKKSNMSIPKFFAKNWEKVKEQLVDSLGNSQMQSRFKSTGMGFDNFVQEFPEVPKDYRGGEGDVGRTIIEFPNGFKWIALDRESCEKEGNAGGHCGNAGDPRRGDNILSLRDKSNRVYATFVINNGYLTERKANGNKKPGKELHPYIVGLLNNPLVKGIGEGKYLTEMDFNLTDLDHDRLVDLAKARPDLVNFSKIDFAFANHSENPNGVIKKLKEKYPKLKELEVTGYDKEDRALIIGSGEHVINQHEGWKRAVGSMLEFDERRLDYDENQIIEHAIYDMPLDTMRIITDYFRSKLTQDKDREITKEAMKDMWFLFMRRDKNFGSFVRLSLKQAHEKSAILFINSNLKHQDQNGFYYKLRKAGGYVLAYKQLRTAFVKKVKPKGIVDPELYTEEVGIRLDFYVEALKNNIKMLLYPGER